VQAEHAAEDDDSLQSEQSNVGSVASACSSQVGWSRFQMSLFDNKQGVQEELNNCILLDDGLSTSLFRNKNLMEQIHDSNKTLELVMNAGT